MTRQFKMAKRMATRRESTSAVFINTPKIPLPGTPHNLCLACVLLYVHGLSMNSIAKLFGFTPPAVLKWIKTFGRQHFFKPEPISDAVVLEIDEMHHLSQKEYNKVWIWKA